MPARRPLLIAGSVALLSAMGLFIADQLTLPILKVPVFGHIDTPILDGDISDAAWRLAKPTAVVTAHGGDFGGTGETRIEVRAIHDERYIYFAIIWDDPTRSLTRTPLVKANGAWRVMQTDLGRASETHFYDDRLAIMLAASGSALIGGAIHLEPGGTIKGTMGSTTQRGFHYTKSGVLDIWEWNAVANAVTPKLQDAFLGPPLEPTVEQKRGKQRYTGGFALDPGPFVLVSNFADAIPPTSDLTVVPHRLPDNRKMLSQKAKHSIVEGHSSSKDEVGQWALPLSTSVPYSLRADGELPDGSMIPGVVVNDILTTEEREVQGVGHWAGDQWVLELRRALGGEKTDVAIKSDTLMWLAAFDHSQTRHTYHLRPLKLELE
jgi:ethylbenzene dehydrogenase